MLKINGAFNKGILGTEYLSMTVEGDIPDLSAYLVLDSTYKADGKPSNKLRHMYCPTKWKVTKGVNIKLMTKSGTDGYDPKTNILNLYWNLDETVWNKGGDCAFVVKSEEIIHGKV